MRKCNCKEREEKGRTNEGKKYKRKEEEEEEKKETKRTHKNKEKLETIKRKKIIKDFMTNLKEITRILKIKYCSFILKLFMRNNTCLST